MCAVKAASCLASPMKKGWRIPLKSSARSVLSSPLIIPTAIATFRTGYEFRKRSDISEETKEKILWENAARLYGIG